MNSKPNVTPLTTEERLYSLSKQKLWDHVAQEQNRSMLESEEYDLWLVATESCREEIDKLRSELKWRKEHMEQTDKELVQLEDWLGAPCESDNQKDKLRERVRDLIASEVEVGDLFARVAELEKDKERLDWIEQHKAALLYSSMYSVWAIQGVAQIIGNMGKHRNMREAIDAAIAAQKGKDEFQRAQG